MPIRKFGLSEQRNDDDLYYRWNGIMRNYIYENALCRIATDFVALSVDDDVDNKRFMQQACKF